MAECLTSQSDCEVPGSFRSACRLDATNLAGIEVQAGDLLPFLMVDEELENRDINSAPTKVISNFKFVLTLLYCLYTILYILNDI